jgi:hypothetical protein
MTFVYCPQITSWPLRGIKGVSAVRGGGGVQCMQGDGRRPISQRQRDAVIHSLTANIGQFKYCNSLVHFFLWGANVFTLDSIEHYFRSRNRAVPQDSHSLRGSTRDLWTVQRSVGYDILQQCAILSSISALVHNITVSMCVYPVLASKRTMLRMCTQLCLREQPVMSVRARNLYVHSGRRTHTCNQ